MKPDPLAHFKGGKSHDDCQCQHCKRRSKEKRERNRQLRAKAKVGLQRDIKEES